MEHEVFEGNVYFHISVVSDLVGLSTQAILRYERLGLIRCAPGISKGQEQERCYDAATLDRLRRIRVLTADLGVNLAGVEIVLELLDQIEEIR